MSLIENNRIQCILYGENGASALTPSEKTNLFVKHAKKICRRHGVSLRFLNKKYASTDGRDKVQGYFFEGDEDEKANIAIAKDNPRTDWLGCLCHELGHMFQWLEGDLTYVALDFSGADANGIFDDDEESEENRHKAMMLVLANELDAERRAVDLIIKWDLPINIERYTKQSNAILYYHHIALETGKWAEKKTLNTHRILEKMPSTFDNDYSIIADDIKELMTKINKEKVHANLRLSMRKV